MRAFTWRRKVRDLRTVPDEDTIGARSCADDGGKCGAGEATDVVDQLCCRDASVIAGVDLGEDECRDRLAVTHQRDATEIIVRGDRQGHGRA